MGDHFWPRGLYMIWKSLCNRSVYVLFNIPCRWPRQECLEFHSCTAWMFRMTTSCITHNKYTQSRHTFLHLTFQKILQSHLPRSEEELAETSTWRPLLESALSTLLLKHNTWRKNFKTVNLLLTGISWSQSMQHMNGKTVYKSWGLNARRMIERASYIRLIELGNLCEKFQSLINLRSVWSCLSVRVS